MHRPGAFYRLPSKAAFRSWRGVMSDDFLFTVKANRFLTASIV